MLTGSASFVLPSFRNTRYISILPGSYFGELDILGSSQTMNFDIVDWFRNRNLLYRQFSVVT